VKVAYPVLETDGRGGSSTELRLVTMPRAGTITESRQFITIIVGALRYAENPTPLSQNKSHENQDYFQTDLSSLFETGLLPSRCKIT
jgi:exopolyphosphatase/pppGpp-phosphohydrolase